MFHKKRILLPRTEAGGFLGQSRPTSELVAQGYLDLAYCIDYASGTLGHAESATADKAIQRSKDMPVEGIGNVSLEYERVSFANRSALNNRKILAEVMLAANVAECQRQVSKLVAALSDKSGGILVEEGGAIEIVVGARTHVNFIDDYMLVSKQTCVWIFETATGRSRRVEGRLARAVNRHPRYEAVLEVAPTE